MAGCTTYISLKETHWSFPGQPAAVVPVPVYILYVSDPAPAPSVSLTVDTATAGLVTLLTARTLSWVFGAGAAAVRVARATTRAATKDYVRIRCGDPIRGDNAGAYVLRKHL